MPARERKDNSFLVRVLDKSEEYLWAEAKKNTFTEEEMKFLQSHDVLEKMSRMPPFHNNNNNNHNDVATATATVTTNDLTEDYSSHKIAELKERCRQRGLAVSGTKAVLLQRVLDDVETESKQQRQQRQQQQQQQHKPATTTTTTTTPSSPIIQYLDKLIKEYLLASGGEASSRDIGRYLTAKEISERRGISYGSALKELKDNFGSLNGYLTKRQDVFVNIPMEGLSFGVRIQ